jgi:site-specific DNA-methyltransferase (adenine-specific)
MSFIAKLAKIIEDSRIEYQSLQSGSFFVSEKVRDGANLLAHGDNALFMKYLMEKQQLSGKINLVYIDPPFFSKANYGTEVKLSSEKIKKIPAIKQKAYHDLWEDGMEEYLRMLTVRFFLIKDLLAEEGCLWVHLDWHSVHYVKVILDEIFGEKNFINEIIWTYKSGGVSKNYFARKHDNLLFYAKSPKYYFQAQQEKSYNRDFKPYRFKGVKEYKDETGWYTMVNMKDVWQINMVGRTSAERTGYATQKPEQLIERILESCTKEGDLCADFFGGSGTLAAAADKMKRRWISCDIGKLAVANAHKRLVQGSRNGYLLLVDEKSRNGQGVLQVEAKTEPSDISEKLELTVEVKSYKPDSLAEVPVDEKYIPIVRNIIKNDSLQLVDYWSIDFDYDGIEYIPDLFFCKNGPAIPFSCRRTAAEFHKIGIMVIDVFGNRSFTVIDLEGEL